MSTGLVLAMAFLCFQRPTTNPSSHQTKRNKGNVSLVLYIYAV